MSTNTDGLAHLLHTPLSPDRATGCIRERIKYHILHGNRQRALELVDILCGLGCRPPVGKGPVTESAHNGSGNIGDHLEQRMQATQRQLNELIALHAINTEIFAKLNAAIKHLQRLEDFNQLPDVLHEIALRMHTGKIEIVLEKSAYGPFVSKRIGILPHAALGTILDWMVTEGHGQHYIGPSQGIRGCVPLAEILPSTLQEEGSCLIYPFYERGGNESLAGLVCLHDKDPKRYSPHKATDYLEHFCYILGCTVSLIRVQKFLERERFTDPLTGIPNRAYLMAYGQRILDFAERKGFPVTLLFIDLDGFKAVNDNFGHKQGDLVLKKVAHSLKALIRKYDLVVRLSGDEFVVLLPGVAKKKTRDLIQRMQSTIATTSIGKGTECAKISASIGGSDFTPGETIRELISRADREMYAHKKTTHR
ncbi:bifunctional diguanylate cyclase/phosphodiesterase [Desulfoplanes sp.]